MLTRIRSTLDRWHNDTNEVSERVMYDEYWWLLKYSMYPDLRRQCLLRALLTQLSIFSIMLSHVYFFVKTTFLCMDDFVVMASCVNYMMLSVFMLALQMITMYCRGDINSMHTIIGTIKDKYGNDNSTEVREIKTRNLKFKKVVKTAIPMVSIMCGLAVVIVGPIVDGLTGKSNTKTNSDSRVNHNLPITIWYPFESHQGFSSICALLFQSSLVLIIVLLLQAVGWLYVNAAVTLASHFELMTQSVTNIEEESHRLFQRSCSHRERKLLAKDIYSHPDFVKSMELCLFSIIKHHQALLRLKCHLCRWSKYALTVTVSASGVTLALSAFLVTSVKDQPGALIAFLIMCAGQVFFLLVVCYLGQNIYNKNQQFHEEVYKMNWFNYPKPINNIIKVMHVFSGRDIEVTGMFSFTADMETFGKILNSAYSYMSLLLAWDAQ